MSHRSMQKNQKREFTSEQFYKFYKNLCRITGFELTAYPVFIGTAHSTWEMGIKYELIKLNSQTSQKIYSSEEFYRLYQKMCNIVGYELGAYPVLVPTAHSTWEYGVRYEIVGKRS